MSSSKALVAGFIGGTIATLLVGVLLLVYYENYAAPDSQAFIFTQGKNWEFSGKNVRVYIINGRDLRDEIIPRIFNETLPSVVHITTKRNLSFHPVPVEGTGSGIIIREDGYILTNYHVVGNAEHPMVVLYNGEEYEAEVVGRDPITDLAVLKIPKTGLKPAKLGDSSKIRVGETAIAIGNPFRFSNTLTVGVISALNRSFRIESTSYVIEGAIQTDAAINPGNSGGPLLNLKGEVIGINTAIFSTTQGFQGIGLAIPINTAKKVAEEIIKKGKVTRAWLGITGTDFIPSPELNVSLKEGALVITVDPRGPSYGILRGTNGTLGEENFTLGDIIVEIDGKKIRNMDDVIKAVLSHRVGDKIKVKFYREGKFYEVEITLGERPKDL